VMFIFCTTEIQKVKATIKSRCVHVQFPGVSDEVVIAMVKNICGAEQAEIEDDAAKLIAQYAFGSLRDAQSILEGFIRTKKVTANQVKQVYQTIDPNTILTYFNNIADKDMKSATNMTKGWLRLGIGPELMINGLLEHLRNMVMIFKVEDKTLKSLLKAQREKIGEGRVADWIEFFYDQLKFIRDYPMEYSLSIDLITIKLIDSLTAQKSLTKKKKGEEEPVVEIIKAATKTDTIAPLDKEKILKLQQACSGIIAEVDPQFRRVTIKNKQGTIFDVTSHVSLVKSDYYIMDQDLDFVIQGYPESMETAVKIK